jgi:hypothetical protein
MTVYTRDNTVTADVSRRCAVITADWLAPASSAHTVSTKHIFSVSVHSFNGVLLRAQVLYRAQLNHIGGKPYGRGNSFQVSEGVYAPIVRD